VEESVEPVKKEHVEQIHNFEANKNNLSEISKQNSQYPIKFQTCPDDIIVYNPNIANTNFSFTPHGMNEFCPGGDSEKNYFIGVGSGNMFPKIPEKYQIESPINTNADEIMM
jgi:hypothetical protein